MPRPRLPEPWPGARRAYLSQRSTAKRRGIDWALTFDDWCRLWLESDAYQNRGRRRDELVMARLDDRGPYSLQTAFIVPCWLNGAMVSRAARSARARAAWVTRRARAAEATST